MSGNTFSQRVADNNLHIVLSPTEAQEFSRLILDRALNTLEPHKWPGWLKDLEARVATYLQENQP